MLQHTRRQVELFEIHWFSMFFHGLVCYFSYETKVDVSMIPCSQVYYDILLKILSGIEMFPISGDGTKGSEF